MKRILIIVFVVLATTIQAQNESYNTKKGYAVKGYDAVCYFKGKAQEGKKQFVTTYDKVRYKFASEDNLEAFKANPTKYLPEYGGYCAYAVAVKGKKVDVDPETFEIRNGKLYLFYNSWGSNTLELWKKENTKGLVKKADQNWESIKLD